MEVLPPIPEPARSGDLPAIAQYLHLFKLDDEDLQAEQFVVLRERGEVIAFGRIKPYRQVFELGAVGVIEAHRGRGLGTLIVETLIRQFPRDEVYITTDLPGYFERFGFRPDPQGPPELVEKLRRVCDRLRKGAVVMVLHRRGGAHSS